MDLSHKKTVAKRSGSFRDGSCGTHSKVKLRSDDFAHRAWEVWTAELVLRDTHGGPGKADFIQNIHIIDISSYNLISRKRRLVSQLRKLGTEHRMTIETKLRERLKELSCLYEVVHVATEPGATLATVLERIVELLPPAWQYPDIAAAKIHIDASQYISKNYRNAGDKQIAKLTIGGKERGFIEVVYTEQTPPQDEGPFLIEERRLINALAGEISSIIERHEANEEKLRLEKQLRHADRLATVGQLAASIAHELNEPLSSILGFAQLAQKNADLPSQTQQDLSKIVKGSLYAREIVNKLRLFARQMPSHQQEININRIVEESLSFTANRCLDNNVTVRKHLEPRMPLLMTDPGQLHQMIVNLTVNAIQSMPNGGQLTMETRTDVKAIYLVIRDTGHGMSPDVIDKIFLPFFTTKDADQGTGLGLSIVHGIVNAQGASIAVESHPNRGSQFTISFPRHPSGHGNKLREQSDQCQKTNAF